MPLPIVLALLGNSGHILPVELRCEAMTEPLGIDRTRPALSWKLEAAQPELRGLKQIAYRILVAGDPAKLEPGEADLWDSGKVLSNETYGIEYNGKALRSGQPCWWKVQVWDGSDRESDWSPRAHFSIGLLAKEDWKAKWIAIDSPTNQSGSFPGASWIWTTADKQGEVPKVTRTFYSRFTRASAAKGTLHVTADDQFTAYLNGRQVGKSDFMPDAWRRPVAMEVELPAGENQLSIVAENHGSQAGVIAKLVIQDGQTIVSDQSWTDQDGKPVHVLGELGIDPWGTLDTLTLRPATLYRKRFSAKTRLKRAMAYVTALGLVDLYLNGSRVSEDLFTPGWTDYEKRVYYRTFEVTDRILQGENTIAAELGDGWYSGYVGFGKRRSHYGDRPRLLVQLELEYEDGTRETVATDRSWRAALSPRVEQDFLMGEVYDARLELKGWSEKGFEDADWQSPYEVTDVKVKIDAFNTQPVREYQRLNPNSTKEISPGTYIVDFGQNLAGFASMKLQAKAGTEVRMRFAEVLNPDGTLYTANLRAARCEDAYICKGGGPETWEPRFTFHGFRYVEVTGLDRPPTGEEIEAVAISTATPEVGTIETSEAMLNRLSQNAWWTQKMNFIDIPTDCPQRDERLGWTGDAQAYIRTATMYSDVQSFFQKWHVALVDGQRADGQFPMVAPLKVAWEDGGPAWADAGVICPWTIYDVYGDKRQLEELYPSMVKFVEFCRNRSTKDLLPPEKFHCFGDWLSINAETPHEVIYMAYFAGSSELLSKAAEVLGNKDDAAKYANLSTRVKAAFNKAYVSPDGVVKGDTQCGYVLALAFDLVEGQQAQRAAERLVADIEKRGWHLSTGFVGTRDLMHVLSKIGRNDVAFRLLHNKTFPSWGFGIENGATTIWERWDGWTPEKGFQDPGMNSFAHYAYGAVMGWVFEQIGGIDNASAGFEKIRIAPQIDPNLTFARTSYNSVRGPIRTEWQIHDGKLHLKVEVPPNTTAEVHLPTRSGGVMAPSQIHSIRSGVYDFEAAWT